MCIISGLKSKSNKFWWTDRTYFHIQFIWFFSVHIFVRFGLMNFFSIFACKFCSCSFIVSSFHFGISRLPHWENLKQKGKNKIVFVSCISIQHSAVLFAFDFQYFNSIGSDTFVFKWISSNARISTQFNLLEFSYHCIAFHMLPAIQNDLLFFHWKQ